MKKKGPDHQLQPILEKILELLGVGYEVESREDQETIYLSIKSDQAALLIGYHGNTINSLQLLMGAIARRHDLRVVVDVDNWRVKREEQLTSLARGVAQRVREQGREEPLYNLTANERRVVHLALTEEPGVATESVGEGRERHLVVKPAT